MHQVPFSVTSAYRHRLYEFHPRLSVRHHTSIRLAHATIPPTPHVSPISHPRPRFPKLTLLSSLLRLSITARQHHDMHLGVDGAVARATEEPGEEYGEEEDEEDDEDDRVVAFHRAGLVRGVGCACEVSGVRVMEPGGFVCAGVDGTESRGW